MKKFVFAVSCLATFSLLALEKPATVPEVTRWESGNGVLKLPADVKRIVETKLDKAAKDLGTEGYTMDIGPRKIRITAATQTGLFYAAQTLKQMVKTSGGNLPQGKITDVPKYRVRGFVFDVGRLPVPIEFLYEVVDIMASYKMNDLQLHLNDNYIWHEDYVKQGKDPFKESASSRSWRALRQRTSATRRRVLWISSRMRRRRASTSFPNSTCPAMPSP